MLDRAIAASSIVSLLASLLALTACEEATVRPPPPPDPDGAVIRPPPPPPRRDAGVLEFDAALPDASSGRDAEVTSGCVSAGPLNDAMVTRDEGSEYPFEPTDVFVTWTDMFCDDPTLMVGFSEAGCTAGIDPKLLFLFRAEAVGTDLTTGEIDLGAATLDDALRIRFEDTGADWGTCPGAAGVLTIESLGTEPGDRFAVEFDLTLTDCSATEPPVAVNGRFSIVLATPLEDVCPP
jgi:hypothetical protein